MEHAIDSSHHEVKTDPFLYGLIAEFEDPDDLIAASARTHEAGYRRIDAYTPFPIDGLSEALGFRDHLVPLIMLIGGIVGCISGFSLLYWCTLVAYPLNIGGAPLFGWPSFIPITFETTILFTALAGVFGMILLNGLPMPYHPVFDAPRFELATSSRFFLCIESMDPRFDLVETRRFMETFGAVQVSEVELRK